jgi:hypothetical protein
VLFEVGASLGTKPRTQRRLSDKAGQSIGKRVHISDRHEEAVFSVADNIGHGADRRHDGAETVGHAFQEGKRQVFCAAWQNEDMSRFEQALHVPSFHPAGEGHSSREAKRPGQSMSTSALLDIGPTSTNFRTLWSRKTARPASNTRGVRASTHRRPDRRAILSGACSRR